MNVEYLSKLYHFLIQTRYFHVETESHASHKALGDLYTTIDALVDGIIEMAYGETMGRTKKQVKMNPLLTFEHEKMVVYYKDAIQDVESMKKATKNSGLKNAYDELIGAITKFLYLTTLKK